MRKAIKPVYTVRDIKKFENISQRVSKQYVPIFSTDLIKILAPEFELVKAQKTSEGSTRHYVDLINDKKDTIRIYNSYDRSLAFRMALISGEYSIDLGTDRIIHRGKNAAGLVETITEHKSDILDGVKAAKRIKNQLKDTKVNKEMAENISDSIFSYLKGKKGFESYTNYIDILLESKKGLTADQYINKSIDKWIKGEYTITFNGKKRNGRKTGSAFGKVQIEARIVSNLIETFPEYFL